LAHHGVLFLDELPEFNKNVIEILRQPIEDGSVTISRVSATLTYPSKFMLIASMNPCPCGYYPDIEKCHCSPIQIMRYLSKISGPLLDRIDIHIEASAISYDSLHNSNPAESSKKIKARIGAVHKIQQKRYVKEGIHYNAHLGPQVIKTHCIVDKEGTDLLEAAFKHLELSARAYYKVLKVARTIADLGGAEVITAIHVAEAISYRTLDRKYWNR
jgi:magnesium chelatase family protein